MIIQTSGIKTLHRARSVVQGHLMTIEADINGSWRIDKSFCLIQAKYDFISRKEERQDITICAQKKPPAQTWLD
jgi:hypothetical protein